MEMPLSLAAGLAPMELAMYWLKVPSYMATKEEKSKAGVSPGAEEL